MRRLLMRLHRVEGISCAQVRELVQSYLDGELGEGSERERLVAHLDRCRPCGVEAETYARIKAAIAPDPPAEVVERLARFAASIGDGGEPGQG